MGGSWRVTGSDLRKWLPRVRFEAMVLWIWVEISNQKILKFIFFSDFNPDFRGTNQNSGQFLNKCFSWTPGTNWLEDKEMSQRRPNSPVLITMGKI